MGIGYGPEPRSSEYDSAVVEEQGAGSTHRRLILVYSLVLYSTVVSWYGPYGPYGLEGMGTLSTVQ